MQKIKGFTLIELIITIIILGILAAVGIANYTTSIERTRGDVCINNIRAILAAWQIYNMKNEPDYAIAPVTHYSITTINSTLGILIDEDNFGQMDAHGETPGFYMRYIQVANPYYYIAAYRLSGTYSNRYIHCNYYPDGMNGDGTGTHYDWQTSATPWPWMPDDE